MKCLVTGATGFTGGHLARVLVREGHEVRALVRQPEDVKRLEKEGITCVLGDLRDAGAVERAAQDTEIIYHIAAIYRQAGLPDEVYRDINVGGTRHVLDAARKCRSVHRVVHCSTVGVHGDIQSPPADETAPLCPGDIYQTTKMEADRMALESFQNGLTGTVFRPTGIYGPGDLRFLKLFRTIYRGQFRMFGSGRAHYHMTYIDDLVRGIILLGSSRQASGQVYILGGTRAVTLNELVREVAHALGVPAPSGHLPLWPLKAAAHACEWILRPFGIEPPLYPRRVDFFYKERAFDVSKAKRELGFEAKTDLTTGLKRTADWYRQENLL